MKIISRYYQEQSIRLYGTSSKTTEKRIERAITAIFRERNWTKNSKNLELLLQDAEIKKYISSELDNHIASKNKITLATLQSYLKVPLIDAFRNFFELKTINIINDDNKQYAMSKGKDNTGFYFLASDYMDDCSKEIDNPFYNKNWKMYYIGLCSLYAIDDYDTRQSISINDMYRMLYNHDTGRLSSSSLDAFRLDFNNFVSAINQLQSGKGLTIYAGNDICTKIANVNIIDDVIQVHNKPSFAFLANKKIEGLERKLLGTGKADSMYARLLITEAVSRVKRANGKLSNHISMQTINTKYDIDIDKRTAKKHLDNLVELGYIKNYNVKSDSKNNSWIISIDYAAKKEVVKTKKEVVKTKNSTKYYNVYRESVSHTAIGYYINPHVIKSGTGIWCKGVSYNIKAKDVLFPLDCGLSIASRAIISKYILANLENWKANNKETKQNVSSL